MVTQGVRDEGVSRFAPADFTILDFPVPDIAAAVDELTSRGVTFQRYEGMPFDDRGVMTGGGPLIAWFTDPAGATVLRVQATVVGHYRAGARTSRRWWSGSRSGRPRRPDERSGRGERSARRSGGCAPRA
jgi:hypothetical protein